MDSRRASLSNRRGTLLERFVNSASFGTLSVGLILLNIALLMLEHHPMEHELTEFLETSNLYITILFTIEMGFKLLAFGCGPYWGDSFNRFDGLIVICSLVDVITEDWGLLPPDAPAFTVLRAFRLLRVFRLLKSWTSLQKLLNALMTSLAQLFYLIILISLLLFIFALLGMQLFGAQYTPERGFVNGPPRANFDSIGNAMITVVVVALSENWNVVWMETKRAVGGWSALYFVPLTFIANYIMINLVVATLIATFDAQAADDRKKHAQMIEERRRTAGLPSSREEDEEDEDGGNHTPASAPPPTPPPSPPEAGGPPGARATELNNKTRETGRQVARASTALPLASKLPSGGSSTGLPFSDATRLLSPAAKKLVRNKLLAEVNDDDILELTKASRQRSRVSEDAGGRERHDHSLLLFSPAHPLRRAAHALVEFRARGTAFSFDNLIILFIIASSVAMAYDSCDVTPGSELALKLQQIDKVAMAVFVSELVAKVIAYGLAFTPHAYLKDGWNRLDFFIVGASVYSMYGPTNSPVFRVMRVVRVLRPLRLISRFSGMRQAIQLLLKAMPAVLDVFVIYLLFLDVFAILGVQLFAGRLSSCTDTDLLPDAYELQVGSFDSLDSVACAASASGGSAARWANPSFGSFDNVLSSMLVLFEMSTLEGWTDVMWACVDGISSEDAPVRDAFPVRTVFHIGWIVLGSVLLLNLFVGVLVNVFAEMKRQEEEEGGDDLIGAPSAAAAHDGAAGQSRTGVLMTPMQKEWAESMEALLEIRPKKLAPCPSSTLRAACFHLVRAPRFEMAILGAILFNTALMALDGYGIPAAQAQALAFLNQVCTVIFILECLAKVAAFGMILYLEDPWHVFDFFVVLLSLVDWLATAAAMVAGGDAGTNPTLIRAIRLVRVVRVLRTFRLLKSARSLRLLLGMLFLSLPALSNILGIFIIILVMYSLLAMQLFGEITYGGYIRTEANFCSFPVAFLTLFRVSTGEAWNGLMHDAMVTPEFGGCSWEDGNCGSWLAVPFFVSFVLLTTFIVLKMMIALILENYLKTLRRDRNSVQPDDAEAFVEAWSVFDPSACGWIRARDAVDFVKSLPAPLGLSPNNVPSGVVKRVHVQKYVFQLDLRPLQAASTGELVVNFKQFLAAIVRDANRVKSAGRTKQQVETALNSLHDEGEESKKLTPRVVEPWGNVITANAHFLQNSKYGIKLMKQLKENDILDRNDLQQTSGLLPASQERSDATPASPESSPGSPDLEGKPLSVGQAAAASFIAASFFARLKNSMGKRRVDRFNSSAYDEHAEPRRKLQPKEAARALVNRWAASKVTEGEGSPEQGGVITGTTAARESPKSSRGKPGVKPGAGARGTGARGSGEGARQSEGAAVSSSAGPAKRACRQNAPDGVKSSSQGKTSGSRSRAGTPPQERLPAAGSKDSRGACGSSASTRVARASSPPDTPKRLSPGNASATRAQKQERRRHTHDGSTMPSASPSSSTRPPHASTETGKGTGCAC